jgi:hypothetical protein
MRRVDTRLVAAFERRMNGYHGAVLEDADLVGEDVDVENAPASRIRHPNHSSRLHAHHITPHKGDERLFWNTENITTPCEACHNRFAQQVEIHGYSDDIGPDGLPLDPNHPFNR